MFLIERCPEQCNNVPVGRGCRRGEMTGIGLIASSLRRQTCTLEALKEVLASLVTEASKRTELASVASRKSQPESGADCGGCPVPVSATSLLNKDRFYLGKKRVRVNILLVSPIIYIRKFQFLK